MKKLFLLFIPLFLFSLDFKVANYNVENLFDLKKDGTEYKEYIPNNRHSWNKTAYMAKLKNITKVIVDLNADILALEEIENRNALKDLQKHVKLRGVNYPYFAIADSKNSPVKAALLSKFPITSKKEIRVGRSQGVRNILEAHINIDSKKLVVFVNHWKAKSGPESKRITYAKALKKRLDELDNDEDFILIGDFNSNHNEYQTFKHKRKFNNTKGVTGINHILKTVKNNTYVKEYEIKNVKNNEYLYNLWYEAPKKRRWSHKFFKEKGSIDNIIVSPALYDKKGISYIDNSFDRFVRNYFYKKGNIYRWEVSKRGKGKHLGKGFSDHLPIFAKFKTN